MNYDSEYHFQSASDEDISNPKSNLRRNYLTNVLNTPLNQYPMIMAHDAATTYLIGDSTTNLFTRTQKEGGIVEMLKCGARAFDIRIGPIDSSGNVIVHHGPVTIQKPFAHIIDEVINWQRENDLKNPDTLVFLGLSHSQPENSSDLMNKVSDILKNRDVAFITECERFKKITVGETMKLSPDNNIVAALECWEQNYDPSVTCTGFLPSENRTLSKWQYTCYEGDEFGEIPWGRMKKYLNEVTTREPPKDGSLFTTQALWQESAESVVVSEAMGSSLIGDEEKSELNRKIEEMILHGEFDAKKAGMIELNNACHNGDNILKAMRMKQQNYIII